MLISTNERIDAITVTPEATILDTLRVIDGASEHGAPVGIALVVGPDGRLAGIVTDGDVRQAIVEGRSLDVAVSEIMTRKPITVPMGISPTEMLRQMSEKVRRSAHIRDTKVEYLIVASADGQVVDVVDTYELYQRADITNWNVAVLGLGFVGLTLAVTLADVGFMVCGVESDAERAGFIAQGKPHFHEMGLDPLLNHQIAKDQFRVHTAIPAAIDIYIIAVGTPLDEDGTPQLESIREAASSVGAQIKRGDLVMLRSTVPVGTTREIVLPILERKSGLRCGEDFYLSFAPERTVEGQALRELRTLPQVVGGFDRRSVDLTAQLFSKLSPNVVRVNSLEAAELAKLINNSFRDLSFAFANEFAIICDRWNLDAVKIIEAANAGYPRNPIPLPSPGVGGFCLTKDPVIYAWAGRAKGYEPLLPVHGRMINEQMVDLVARKVLRFFEENGLETRSKKVFLVGFAFKGQPDTSDMRHSTTIELLSRLREAEFDLVGFDPVVPKEEVEKTGVRWSTIAEGFEDAAAVLVMNNHPSYSDLDLFSLLSGMQRPGLFVDAWHLFIRREVEQIEGIVYEGLSGAL
jgi:nucleotide sugar dehydrogenase